ncbi:MAG: NnrU family protein [Rhodospirillaceae bacterium]
MALLILAAAVWMTIHWLGPWHLRPLLAPRLGEIGYLGLFTLLSLGAMTGLILGYRAAPHDELLWGPYLWLRPPCAVLIGFGFALIALGTTPDNPTAGNPEHLVEVGALPVRGVTRITRHPVMVGIALWAVAHLLMNGHTAGLVLFGTLLATAVRGMVSLDHKTRLKVGDTAWRNFAAATSRMPFGAISAGRTGLKLGELSPLRTGIGLGLFAAALWLHQTVIGLPPL